MTPLEREIAAMEKCVANSPSEESHIDADEILCRVIEQYVPNGEHLVEAFWRVDKWYA